MTKPKSTFSSFLGVTAPKEGPVSTRNIPRDRYEPERESHGGRRHKRRARRKGR